MQEDVLNFFCIEHKDRFPVMRASQEVICKKELRHVLSADFPHSGRWFFCCHCQTFWNITNEDSLGFGECPACRSLVNPRYYSCDHCNVTTMESWSATGRREVYISPWGVPHPYCPGCQRLPKAVSQSHTCSTLNGLLTTARKQCPFCEGTEEEDPLDASFFLPSFQEQHSIIEIGSIADPMAALDSMVLPIAVAQQSGSTENVLSANEFEIAQGKPGGVMDMAKDRPQVGVKTVTADWDVEPAARKSDSVDTPPGDGDYPPGFLEELERKTAEIQALEIEAAEMALVEAERAANSAEIRARDAEARAERAEALLRETEIRSQAKIEEVISRAQMALVSSEEVQSRIRDFEARYQKVEARAREAEGKLEQTENELQQEAFRRALAEEQINKIEFERIRALEQAQKDLARIKGEYETRIQELESRGRQMEDGLRGEIGEIRSELQSSFMAREREQAEHRVEIERVQAESIGQIERLKSEAREQNEKLQAETKERIEKLQAEAAAQIAEIEKRLNREEFVRTGAEEKVRELEAELQRNQEQAIAQIADIRAEAQKSEEALRQKFAQQTSQALDAIMSDAQKRIDAEIELRTAAEQATAEITAKLEELQLKYQVDVGKLRTDAENKARESEARTRQAETQYRQAYLVSKLSSLLIEQVLAGIQPPAGNIADATGADLSPELTGLLNLLGFSGEGADAVLETASADRNPHFAENLSAMLDRLRSPQGANGSARPKRATVPLPSGSGEL